MYVCTLLYIIVCHTVPSAYTSVHAFESEVSNPGTSHASHPLLESHKVVCHTVPHAHTQLASSSDAGPEEPCYVCTQGEMKDPWPVNLGSIWCTFESSRWFLQGKGEG